MSWTNTSGNGMVIEAETITPPASSTVYTSEIDFLKMDPTKESKNVTFVGVMDDDAVGEVGIDLYGAFETGGTKFLLKSDVFTAFAIGATAQNMRAGVVDLNDYPAPYYYLGTTTVATETGDATLQVLYKP